MSDPRHHLGQRAEMAVASWLTASGWRVLERRHRTSGGGEIDLVALDPMQTLVGIEVRARRSRRTGSAAESVDARRVARIARSLAAYAAASRIPHGGLRVDLVAVEPTGLEGGRYRVRRLPNVGG